MQDSSMEDFSVPSSREVRPRDVVGFSEAQARGILPVVPTSPPPLLPGRTALHMFERGAMKGVGACVLASVVVNLVHGRGPGWFVASAMFGSGGLAMGYFLRVLTKAGYRKYDELQQGYTTLVLHFGSFGYGELRRRKGLGHRVPWDYSGAWVLDNAGAVVSRPDPGVEPPGFYPSPHRQGSLELWTGEVWSGDYRSVS